VPAGTGYLGAFTTQAALVLREQVRVDWSTTVGESFERNQVVFRAEMRAELALFRPSAFATST
jgi:HK97 family phage major capsid protein